MARPRKEQPAPVVEPAPESMAPVAEQPAPVVEPAPESMAPVAEQPAPVVDLHTPESLGYSAGDSIPLHHLNLIGKPIQ